MRLKRVITTGLGAAALAAAATVPAWTAPAAGAAPTVGPSASPFAPGSGQLVADWNKTLITIQGMPGAQPATVHPTRSFAILSGAVYDSVVSITKVGRPYLFKVRVRGRASAAAAADQAAHDVLTALYPAAAETAVTNSQLRSELAQIPGGRAKTEGRRAGAAAAAELLGIRSTDGSSLTPPAFVPGSAVGDYQPTPPAFAPPVFTIWGNVTPFVLRSGSQFRAAAPPPVTSAAYQKSLASTESLGQDTSTTRISDWTASARFWAASPVWNIWNELAQSEVTSHSSSLEGASAIAIIGFVERAGGRLRAVSGICTHQGCRLALAADPARFVCPCHGATFGLDGAVLSHRLPLSLAPLAHIAVREAHGIVQVYATRPGTPPPGAAGPST